MSFLSRLKKATEDMLGILREGEKFDPLRNPGTVPPPAKPLKVGKWYAVERCVGCKRGLSHEDMFETNGVCPHCGVTSNSRFTRTEKITVRKITHADGTVTYEEKT